MLLASFVFLCRSLFRSFSPSLPLMCQGLIPLAELWAPFIHPNRSLPCAHALSHVWLTCVFADFLVNPDVSRHEDFQGWAIFRRFICDSLSHQCRTDTTRSNGGFPLVTFLHMLQVRYSKQLGCDSAPWSCRRADTKPYKIAVPQSICDPSPMPLLRCRNAGKIAAAVQRRRAVLWNGT